MMFIIKTYSMMFILVRRGIVQGRPGDCESARAAASRRHWRPTHIQETIVRPRFALRCHSFVLASNMRVSGDMSPTLQHVRRHVFVTFTVVPADQCGTMSIRRHAAVYSLPSR